MLINLEPSLLNRTGTQITPLSVMAIFKNESHILKEWIDHYLSFGVETIYLINNNSEDSYFPILKPYVLSGIVKLYECKVDKYQNRAYTELLPELVNSTEWVIVCDLDEFIYPKDGNSILYSINKLRQFESILIPWLSFGSSGHVTQPGSVIDNFLLRGPADTSRSFLKPISRPSSITQFNCHNPTTKLGKKVLANGQPVGDEWFIHMNETMLEDFLLINNHYRLQSQEHFMDVKAKRPEGNEDAEFFQKKPRFFYDNDPHWNAVLDTTLRDFKQVQIGRSQAPRKAGRLEGPEPRSERLA